MQGDSFIRTAIAGRSILASSSSLADAAARSRRELRTVPAAAERAAVSRQLLQTAPFTQAEVEKIMCATALATHPPTCATSLNQALHL